MELSDLILIIYPHQGDEIDDLVWSCYCTPCVQCQVRLLLSLCKSWLWSHSHFNINVDFIVDCFWGYCEKRSNHNHNNNYNHQHDNTTGHNSRQHWSIRMTSTMTTRTTTQPPATPPAMPWFFFLSCFFLANPCLTLCLSFTKSSLLSCKQIYSRWYDQQS